MYFFAVMLGSLSLYLLYKGCRSCLGKNKTEENMEESDDEPDIETMRQYEFVLDELEERNKKLHPIPES
jgi:hypothetical protein